MNNAGITRDTLLLRMSEEDFDRVLEVNLRGAFLCMKQAARLMVRQRSGRIVNMSSVVGLRGNAGQVNYAASKAGLIGMTKSLARELAGRGVTVNAVAPGFIGTDMTKGLSDGVKQAILASIPAGRLGLPEEVARQWPSWHRTDRAISLVRCCAWTAAWRCERRRRDEKTRSGDRHGRPYPGGQ